MLHTRTLPALLSAFALTLAQDLMPSVPPSEQPLNLSSPAIDINWNATMSRYQQVNLWFCGPDFGYALGNNISVSDGHYTWDPRNTSDALQSTHFPLTKEAGFYFQATFHDVNSSAGMGVPSEEYKVTGYPYLTNAGSGPTSSSAGFLAVVAVILVVFTSWV